MEVSRRFHVNMLIVDQDIILYYNLVTRNAMAQRGKVVMGENRIPKKSPFVPRVISGKFHG